MNQSGHSRFLLWKNKTYKLGTTIKDAMVPDISPPVITALNERQSGSSAINKGISPRIVVNCVRTTGRNLCINADLRDAVSDFPEAISISTCSMISIAFETIMPIKANIAKFAMKSKGSLNIIKVNKTPIAQKGTLSTMIATFLKELY